MVTVISLLDAEREGDFLVVTPTADLRELDYQQIEVEAATVVALLD